MISELTETTVAAAWIEYHLREAVRITEDAYTFGGWPDKHLVRQWVLTQLMDVFGIPEELCYPLVDTLEYWEVDHGTD